jgi:hypothetical protein
VESVWPLVARQKAASPHTSLVRRFKLVLRTGGVIAFLIGLDVLPLGYLGSPKRDLSAFSNFAHIGAFIKMGFILMGIALIVFILSVLLPGDDDFTLIPETCRLAEPHRRCSWDFRQRACGSTYRRSSCAALRRS